MELAELSRRERNKIKVRNRLLDAGRDLIQENGFDNVSIDEIAEKADVSRSTFFNYFPGKEDLLRGIAQVEMEELQAFISRDESEDSLMKIKNVMHHFARDTFYFLNVTWRAFVDSLSETSREDSPIKQLEKMIFTLVKEAQTAGEIRRDLDPGQVTRTIIGTYISEVIFWYQQGFQTLEVEESDINTPLDLLLRGIKGSENTK